VLILDLPVEERRAVPSTTKVPTIVWPAPRLST